MKLRLAISSLMCALMLIVFSSTCMARERISLGFLQGTWNGIELVNKTCDSLNQVAPCWFCITSNGDLLLTDDVSHTFVQEMHDRGIAVTPFLSNHWERSKGKAALENAESLAIQIANVVEEYNLDGVNVDIENMLPEDRDAFTQFVNLLRTYIPYGKFVTVCVAANPDDSKTGWHGSYDYAALGEIANYVFIMTYDEHVQGSPIGTVASIPFVEKSIENALLYIPKEKLVMGIPLYGRYWNLDTGRGGKPIVIGSIDRIKECTDYVEEFNEIYKQPSLTFVVNNESGEVKINGESLEDGNYIAWFENDESMYAKMQVVNKYQLLGVGVWAIGQENVEFWENYKRYLNETELDLQEYYKKIEEETAAIENEKRNVEEEEKNLISRREKYLAIQIKIECAKDEKNNLDKKFKQISGDINYELEKVESKHKIYEMLPHIDEEFFELENQKENKHKKNIIDIKNLKIINEKYIGKKYKLKKKNLFN